MGTSSSNTTLAGFCLTQNYKGENLLTYDDWANAKRNNPQLFRNTTITGKWDKDYEGKIEIWGASKGLPIWGDTRFENLTFAMNGGDSYKIIYCQYNNILMDEGIRMTGFSHNSPDYGTRLRHRDQRPAHLRRHQQRRPLLSAQQSGQHRSL